MEPISDQLLNSARSLGDWGISLVIFGVIVEVVAGIVDGLSDRYFPQWHIKWKGLLKVIEFVGGGILILGLAMEFRGHKNETAILDKDALRSNEKLKQAIRESGEATVTAGLANERATSNDVEVARLTRINLELEREVVALKIKIQDRRITAEQKRLMLSQLRPIQGEYVVFNFSTGDLEATTFAEDIAGVLSTSGYEIRDFSKQAVMHMEAMA